MDVKYNMVKIILGIIAARGRIYLGVGRDNIRGTETILLSKMTPRYLTVLW